ncbi:hypothetical protein [Sporosarcina aquimarina]|uniref:hypothetical protein n=1 Tax=Sporosarcina aquimarina TaxID=114975 RepID=UPI001C8D19A8|nr:hypothetical protein [Sporosarcina aquimarina]MBY0224099.1 hypothetical protein [Sporosarcina aquimarina]
MNTSKTFEEIKLIHKELDGACQKCGQRCDKRVVSFIEGENGASLMVCPDCLQGKERPFFKASEEIVSKCVVITGWERAQAEVFLENIPLGIALVEHGKNYRKYWNWDKSKAIFSISTDHEGNICKVVYYAEKRKENTLKIKGVKYWVVGKRFLKLDSLEIPDYFIEPNTEKVAIKKASYKEKGNFSGHNIVVERVKKGREVSHIIVDGYSVFVASQELGLNRFNMLVVSATSAENFSL